MDTSGAVAITPPGPSCPEWWVSGRPYRLAPWSQAIIWAALKINEAWNLDMCDNDIASLVQKVGDSGRSDGGPPSKQAVADWRRLIENDPDWYPGKLAEQRKKPGPRKLLDNQKASSIAQSMMGVKRRRVEPSASLAKELCPAATLNPETGKPFSDKYILQVFKQRCFDEGSTTPWSQELPLQKTALPDHLREDRVDWAAHLKTYDERNEGWYFRHVLWIDPCYSILFTNRRQIFDMTQANRGSARKPRWMSKDKKGYSHNMGPSRFAGKQCQNGDRKVWWFIILSRGRVHVEIMEDGWKQGGAGMANFVEKLDGCLRKMLGKDVALPRVVASDRGPGFYAGSSGQIVRLYRQALDDAGFRPFAGNDASMQPPDIPDVLPHETAVGWIRNYLKKYPFSRDGSLDEQEKRLRQVMKDACNHINSTYDAEGLCKAFPARLQQLIDRGGDRLVRRVAH